VEVARINIKSIVHLMFKDIAKSATFYVS